MRTEYLKTESFPIRYSNKVLLVNATVRESTNNPQGINGMSVYADTTNNTEIKILVDVDENSETWKNVEVWWLSIGK